MFEFKRNFNLVQNEVHRIAKEKGWHEKEPRNDAEMICLMHSELSEALEWLRHGDKPSDHIPNFSGVEEELADVIIRIMDYAELKSLNVSEAIITKINFNKTRPHRHGGKKF